MSATMHPVITRDAFIAEANALNECGRYIAVHVYRRAPTGHSWDGGDCTLGGVTSREATLFAPHPRGNFRRDEIQAGARLVVVPRAFAACPLRLAPEGVETNGPAGALMAGGNLVSSSDSRFAELYGVACSVHDRLEPWPGARR